MSMTVGLFESFVAEMDALSAERLLDAARASVAQFWQSDRWDALVRESMGQQSVDAAPSRSAAAGFSLNGAPLDFATLSQSLSRMLGSGVAA